MKKTQSKNETKSKFVTFKIKPSVKKRIQQVAAKGNKTVSVYITELIEKDLQGKEEIEFKK